jgi:hypothetical protein
MRRKLFVLILSVMVSFCWSSAARAAGVASDYLHGNWLLDTAEQACESSDAEYFIFRDNGSFETGRSGKAEAVGFWQLDGDVVHLHLVSSPSFYVDVLKEMSDQFHYFYARLVHFNVAEHRFEVVGVLGNQIRKGVATRCK